MHCIFIYNPNSGNGKIKKHIGLIEKQLKKKFTIIHMYPTKSAEDTKNAAQMACGKYDAIIFSGGDGTFNDVACGVASEEVRPVLGYIPSGTVNDIARNLGISRNIRKALKTITNGQMIPHDVGLINERYFMYVSAIGTFTGVSYRTKQKTKKIFGRLAYALDGLKDIVNRQITPVMVKIDQENITMDVPLLLILNSISVGGIPFNRFGHLNDGLFDVVLVKKDHTKGLLNILSLFTLGIGLKRITKRFLVLRGSEITIEVSEDTVWCVDGEAGPKGKVVIKNLHNHLNIYVPNKKRK